MNYVVEISRGKIGGSSISNQKSFHSLVEATHFMEQLESNKTLYVGKKTYCVAKLFPVFEELPNTPWELTPEEAMSNCEIDIATYYHYRDFRKYFGLSKTVTIADIEKAIEKDYLEN